MTPTERPPAPPAFRLLTTLLASASALWCLWSVTLPPVGSPSLDAGTLARVGPDVLVLHVGTHVARWGATCLLAYLAFAAALNLLVLAARQLGRTTALERWASRVSPRWLALASVGAVATTTLMAPAAGAAPWTPDPGRRSDIVLEVLDAGEAGTDDQTASDRLPAPTTVAAPTTTVPTTTVPTTTMPTTVPRADPPRLEPVGPDQLPPPLVIERPRPRPEHTVQPGEHFWSIAEQVVAERGLDVQVADYWRLLVEANRDRLVDPGNPDLLYPGQQLVLP